MSPILSIIISSTIGGIIGGVSYSVFKTIIAKNTERITPNNNLTRKLKETSIQTGKKYGELLDEAVEQYLSKDIV